MYADAGLGTSPYHLRERHFFMTLGIAVLLHAGVYGAYLLSPRDKVIDIPVRTLNIRLGSEEVMTAPKPAVTEAQLKKEEKSAIVAAPEIPKEKTKPVRGQLNKLEKTIAAKAASLALQAAEASAAIAFEAMKEKEAAEAAKAAKEAKEAAAKKQTSEAAISARQFIRKREMPKPAIEPVKNPKAGSVMGNTKKSDAEMLARYEQTISLWIAKFQVYPAEAYAKKLEGDAIMRVRIDRRGNVRHNTLEKSTGYRDLDRAALDMIRRANPMPPVPAGYPAGELIEFLIPVSFRLQ